MIQCQKYSSQPVGKIELATTPRSFAIYGKYLFDK